MTLADLITQPATFSPCRNYRYSLTRETGCARVAPPILWIMLNPSTADEHTLDHTVSKCLSYSKRWGFGHLLVANLFALRATDPTVMRNHPRPVGAAIDDMTNDVAIGFMAWHVATSGGRIVCAWGNHGEHMNRGADVLECFAPGSYFRDRGWRIHHLGLTNSGHPKHPARLPLALEPQAFEFEPSQENTPC